MLHLHFFVEFSGRPYALSHLTFVRMLRVRSTKMIDTGEDGGGREELSNRVRAVEHVEERESSLVHLMGTI